MRLTLPVTCQPYVMLTIASPCLCTQSSLPVRPDLDGALSAGAAEMESTRRGEEASARSGTPAQHVPNSRCFNFYVSLPCWGSLARLSKQYAGEGRGELGYSARQHLRHYLLGSAMTLTLRCHPSVIMPKAPAKLCAETARSLGLNRLRAVSVGVAATESMADARPAGNAAVPGNARRAEGQVCQLPRPSAVVGASARMSKQFAGERRGELGYSARQHLRHYLLGSAMTLTLRCHPSVIMPKAPAKLCAETARSLGLNRLRAVSVGVAATESMADARPAGNAAVPGNARRAEGQVCQLPRPSTVVGASARMSKQFAGEGRGELGQSARHYLRHCLLGSARAVTLRCHPSVIMNMAPAKLCAETARSLGLNRLRAVFVGVAATESMADARPAGNAAVPGNARCAEGQVCQLPRPSSVVGASARVSKQFAGEGRGELGQSARHYLRHCLLGSARVVTLRCHPSVIMNMAPAMLSAELCTVSGAKPLARCVRRCCGDG